MRVCLSHGGNFVAVLKRVYTKKHAAFLCKHHSAVIPAGQTSSNPCKFNNAMIVQENTLLGRRYSPFIEEMPIQMVALPLSMRCV